MRKWAGVDATTGSALWYINGKDGETTSNYNAAQLAVQGTNSLNIMEVLILSGLQKDLALRQTTYGFGGKY